MSMEKPEGKPQEITADQWKKAAEAAEKYQAQFKQLDKNNVSKSMRHTLANLVTHLSFIEMGYDGTTPESREKIYGIVQNAIRNIDRYYALLEQHPAFAKKEREDRLGYFPELIEQNLEAEKMLDKYEEALQREAEEQKKQND